MKNNWKKIADVLGEGLVILAVLVIVFFGTSKILPSFKYGLYIIQSGSMEPTIKTGSVVVDKKMDEYKKGDIITYRQFRKIITHRISGVVEQNGEMMFETKGDNNNGEDLVLTKKSDVFGKVMFSVPLIGYVMDFARTKIGIFLFILIPAVWLIGLEVLKIKEELAKNKKEIKSEKEDEKES